MESQQQQQNTSGNAEERLILASLGVAWCGAAIARHEAASGQRFDLVAYARPDVLTRLGKRWGCWTLTLPTNYRCGGAVVEVAKALIEGSSLRETATPLLTARDLAGLGRCAISQSSSWLGMLHQPAAWLPRLLSALR